MLDGNSIHNNLRSNTPRGMLTIPDLAFESEPYESRPEAQLAKEMQELYDLEADFIDNVQDCDGQPIFMNKAPYIDKDGYESYSCSSCRFEHDDLSTMIIHCSTQTHLGTSSSESSLYFDHPKEKVSELSYPAESLSVKNFCARTDEHTLTVKSQSQSKFFDKSLFTSSRNADHHQNCEARMHESTTHNMVSTRFNNTNSNVLRQIQEKPYNCTICKKKFSVDKNSTLHTPPKSPYKCLSCENTCKKTVSTSDVLPIQMRRHTGEKSHKRTNCDKSFTQSGHLSDHMRTHTGEKPYECQICKKSFTQAEHLAVHMRTHTGEKPYECTICKESFSVSSSLKIHMRTHTGEKPYECTICKESFSLSCSLKIHMRTHTGEKPYKCTICGKSFRQSSHLTSHERKHHGESHSSVHAAKIRL